MSVTVGQKLRQARQEKNLTLQQISRATYIRVNYLEALEAGQLDRLPSLAQARGFLRSYARHLGLPAESLLTLLDGEALPSDPGETPAPEAAPPPAQPAEEAFVEIGQTLRKQRELLGLNLDDVEHQTRLRIHYLHALENGQMDALPSPVQGRGMLHNYADFLGLEPDPLLQKFADGLQARLNARRGARRTEQPAADAAPRRRANPLRRYLSSDLLIGGALGAALLLIVVWAAVRVSSLQNTADSNPTAPALVDILAPEDTPTPTPTLPPDDSPDGATAPASPSAPTPEAQLPLVSDDSVQLYLVVQQRAWMRITVDGEVQFEGRVIPGSAYSFSGQDAIELLTSSGSALQVFYNQTDLGQLGLFGEIVQRTFTRDGIIVPTPTATPTPALTNTPEITGTPTGAPTPTP